MAEHIGSKVNIPGTRGVGILRYYGEIDGKVGQFGGIELLGPIAATRGKNSGDVDGIEYFKVQTPMTGLFLPWERLKSSNPHLDKKKPTRLKSPDMTRSTISPRSTFNATPSPTSRIATSSPIYPAQQIQIAKRGGVSDDNGGNTQDLNNYKSKYISTQAEMKEKVAILNELQATVNEIQPLLEEYETNLAEKDKKLLKQKQDFDAAREEWRQLIDLMTSTQQENEDYFMKQIELLEEKVASVPKSTDEEILKRDAEIEKLMKEIADLNEGKNKANDLNSQLNNLSISDKDQSSDIAELQSTIDKLKNEITELKKTQEQHLSDIQASHETEIEHLKAAHEKTIFELKRQVQEGSGESKLVTELQEELTRLRASSAKQGQSDTSEYNSLKEKYDTLTADYDKIRTESKQMESLVAENNELKQSNTTARANSETLHAQIDSLSAQVESLTEQLSNQKENEEATGGDEHYKSKIDELQHELKMRPTFEELVELQNSLDELDTLHKHDIDTKEQEINRLRSEIASLREEMETKTAGENKENSAPHSVPINTKITDTPSLPIYNPPVKVDPGDGKQNWCGLCERDGHSSINCPYENDIF